MNHEPKTLDSFLYKYKTKEDDTPTHTKIGNIKLGVYGGSYNVPEDQMELFYKLYSVHTFDHQNPNYLTECQLKNSGPLLVDIDERYSKDITTRKHTKEHITDFIYLLVDKLIKMIVVDNQLVFNIFVFEKDEINLDCLKFTKDGIHYYCSISMAHDAKALLRKYLLHDIGDIYDDLELENSYNDLIDKGVMEGGTNWQLYGSRKPEYQDYKLKYQYEINIVNDNINTDEDDETKDDNNINFDIKLVKTKKINIKELLPEISARNKNCQQVKLKKHIIKEIDDSKNQIVIKPVAFKSDAVLSFETIMSSFQYIDSLEECEKCFADVVEYTNKKDVYTEIGYVHELTMILNEGYYDPWSNWMKICWALRSISEMLYPTFILFSSKSDKFDWNDNDCYELWNSTNYDIEKSPTLGTIKFMARECNNEAVERLEHGNLVRIITYLVKNPVTEWDIAKIVHSLHGDEYKSCAIKKQLWYRFTNNRWEEDDAGTSLRKKLSEEISKYVHNIVNQKLEDLSSKSSDSDSGNAIKNLSTMGMNLKKTAWKQNIMKECQEVFYSKEFMDNLDTNSDLMCFNNGVLDLKINEFRKGIPGDNLSLCTRTNYIELDENDDDHIRIQDEILDFMNKLFPNPNLNKYMWSHLASILKGKNKNQTFNIYAGSGRNGKSKLVELMGLVLGDYKGSVPLTLITRERTMLGQATPEIAQLKGLRYAVMQEPSQSTKLNEGPMKELVGGDPIQCRSLYKDAITFVPQFKLVVCTNHLFDIDSTDDGTWRRIRVCDFVSKFVDNPSTNPKDFEFKKDCDIDKKFKSWVPIFTSMLVKIVFETGGFVEDCDEVMASSAKYKEQQDCFTEFINERIVESEKSIIKKTDLKTEFEEWFTELYSVKIPSGKEIYNNISKKLGEPSRQKGVRGWRGWKLIHSYELENEDTEISANNIIIGCSSVKN
jgi:P4 family phage/plasmid primase-like protien